MPEVTTVQKMDHVPVHELRESAWNPNEEDRQTFDALKASIRQNGLVDPLIVRKAGNSIIGGHHRLNAVLELLAEGWVLPGGTVPVIYMDVTEEEAKRLNLALNRITGEPNLDKLGELLRELRDVSDPDELSATGYSPQEIDDLVALLEADRDSLVRSIEETSETDEEDESVEFTFRFSPDHAQTIREELERLKDECNLTGKDADNHALVHMAARSSQLAELQRET